MNIFTNHHTIPLFIHLPLTTFVHCITASNPHHIIHLNPRPLELAFKMVSSRKRGRQEMEAVSEAPKEPTMIDRLRNMWEFANLAQWIFIFGKTVKMDDNIGIEVRFQLSF